MPDAGHGELRCRDRGERVLKPLRSVVERVVVRHVHDVDTGRAERGERRCRRPEVVVLARDRFAASGDRGLQVHHREVGAGQQRRDGVEHVLRVGLHLLRERRRGRGRPVLGVPLLGEVDVARERERDGVAVAARTACRGRRDGSGRRGGARVRRRGAGRVAPSVVVAVAARGQDERDCDDDHRRECREHVSPHRGTLRVQAVAPSSPAASGARTGEVAARGGRHARLGG